MKYHLPERTEREIIALAIKNNLEKVILFGSRARGDNTEKSDIDLAVKGTNIDSFYWDIKENLNSLLICDIIDLDSGISDDLNREIKKDGVIIYEKAR